MPLTIGLITSDDSAAYNDFISELRKSGYGFKVYLRNTLMQGKERAQRRLPRARRTAADRWAGSHYHHPRRRVAGGIELFRQRAHRRRDRRLSRAGFKRHRTRDQYHGHRHGRAHLRQNADGHRAISRHARCENSSRGSTNGWNASSTKRRQHSPDYKQHLKDLAAGLQQGTMFFFKDHQEQLIRLGRNT